MFTEFGVDSSTVFLLQRGLMHRQTDFIHEPEVDSNAARKDRVRFTGNVRRKFGEVRTGGSFADRQTDRQTEILIGKNY